MAWGVGPLSIVPVNLQQLTESLRDPAVFNQHVKTNNPLRGAGIGALALGLLFMAYNAFSTWRAVSGTPISFWKVFWTTEGATGKDTVWLYIYVYGGPILLLAGIVLLVLSFMNSGSHSQGQHERYLRGGYVAHQEQLGIKYSETTQRGARIPLAVLTAPGQSDEDYAQMVQYLRQRVADKEEGKRVSKAMARVHGGPVPLSTLMPDLPAQNLVGRYFPFDPVVVMPPAKPGGVPEILKTSS